MRAVNQKFWAKLVELEELNELRRISQKLDRKQLVKIILKFHSSFFKTCFIVHCENRFSW
jgi:hypothetical protein